jgi:hypothetical protein
MMGPTEPTRAERKPNTAPMRAKRPRWTWRPPAVSQRRSGTDRSMKAPRTRLLHSPSMRL